MEAKGGGWAGRHLWGDGTQVQESVVADVRPEVDILNVCLERVAAVGSIHVHPLEKAMIVLTSNQPLRDILAQVSGHENSCRTLAGLSTPNSEQVCRELSSRILGSNL